MYIGLRSFDLRGMRLSNIEAAGIATMAIVTIDSVFRVSIVGKFFQRHEQSQILSGPQVLLSVTSGAAVLVEGQLRTGWRLSSYVPSHGHQTSQ
jgi:hypothetical protein